MRRKLRVSSLPLAGLLLAGCVAVVLPGGCARTTGPNGAPDVAGMTALAERGNPIAANDLGVLYANGLKVPQDFTQAKKWYDFASAHGNAVGDYNLGWAYEHGQGTPIDMAEALRLYHVAADHNVAAAEFELGDMARNGRGVPQNDDEAARWFHAAAIQGFGPGQAMMALIYSEGRGADPDDGLAYEWASLAAVRLIGPVGQIATRLRDAAANNLTPAILTVAQAATTQWKPGSDLTSPFPPGSGPRPKRVRGQGSGFIIGKNGEIATDFHVVRGCAELRVKSASGQFNVLTHVIAEDRPDDLAMLADGGFGGRLKLRPAGAELGENIVTYGFPLGQVLSGSGNLTTGSVSSTTGFQGSDKTFQFSAPGQPGNSGGPVVDQSGAVIGIFVSKLNALAVAAAIGDISQNVNFATNAGLLRALMDRHGIGYELSGPPHPRSNTELADELQKATVKIECWR